MARGTHHSRNWGGARPGSGPKKASYRELAERAIAMADAAGMHPLEFILQILGDKSKSDKIRLDAANAALPYCMPKLSAAEINVHASMDSLTDQQITERYQAISRQLEHMPQFEFINGHSERVADPVPARKEAAK